MITGLNPRAEVALDGFALDPSCVLYLPLWKLDGDSFMSKDAYGHLCTNHGALWTPRGRRFDGEDDYVDCGSDTSLDLTDEITIEAWMKIKDFTDAGYLLARNLASPIDSMQYGIYVEKTEIVYIIVEQSTWDTEKAVTIGKRTHLVALIKSGSYQKLYLNGVYQGKTTCPTIVSRDWKLLIGMRNDNGGQKFPFNGLIAIIRIYNRALTPQEILDHYIIGKEMFG